MRVVIVISITLTCLIVGCGKDENEQQQQTCNKGYVEINFFDVQSPYDSTMQQGQIDIGNDTILCQCDTLIYDGRHSDTTNNVIKWVTANDRIEQDTVLIYLNSPFLLPSIWGSSTEMDTGFFVIAYMEDQHGWLDSSRVFIQLKECP